MSHLDVSDALRRLSEPDLEAMGERLHQLSEDAGHELSFGALVHSWQTFVDQIEDGYDDSIYEYMNDLSVRAIIEQILKTASPMGQYTLSKVIQALDARFAAITTETAWTFWGGTVSRSSAWWHRIPIHPGSQLREDLQSEGMLPP